MNNSKQCYYFRLFPGGSSLYIFAGKPLQPISLTCKSIYTLVKLKKDGFNTVEKVILEHKSFRSQIFYTADLLLSNLT